MIRVSRTTFFNEPYFLDPDQLDRLVPSGSYSLWVALGGGPPVSTTPVTLRDGGGFAPTLATNFEALQSWSESTLTLHWQPITGARPADFIQFRAWRDMRMIESSVETTPGPLLATATSLVARDIAIAPGVNILGALTYAHSRRRRRTMGRRRWLPARDLPYGCRCGARCRRGRRF